MRGRFGKLAVVALVAGSAVVASTQASADRPVGAGPVDEVVAHWTPERIATAQPRDLVIDSRGRGYQRNADGSLTPHGHNDTIQLESITRASKAPTAKPSGGGNDTTPPAISGESPAASESFAVTTETVIEFSATVNDDSGIRGANIVIRSPGGTTQSFAATSLGNDRWGTSLKGFTPGEWAWQIVATDGSRNRNSASSAVLGFTVTDGSGGNTGGGGGGGTIVTNSRWMNDGDVQGAAGRILFEMPTAVRKGRTVSYVWQTYVCSGTAVTDSHSDASIILTAAHCVYDDVTDEFAQNVLFIPNQDDGGTDTTDDLCTNDKYGCWAPTNGVVHPGWASATFPDNVAWDYGYYVVPNTGAHSAGRTEAADSLEAVVNELVVAFNTADAGKITHALGYSYDKDPNFMYCAEAMGVETPGVNWWLPSCGLTGGSSGGPWIQPMTEATGTGPIISVNSWGYVGAPGMAGPVLGLDASCTFGVAQTADVAQATARGVIATGC